MARAEPAARGLTNSPAPGRYRLTLAGGPGGSESGAGTLTRKDCMSSIEDFLSKGTEPLGRRAIKSRKCIICTTPQIEADVQVYVEALRTGRTKNTPYWVWQQYILPKYGVPRSDNSLRHHILKCMGVDYTALLADAEEAEE